MKAIFALLLATSASQADAYHLPRHGHRAFAQTRSRLNPEVGDIMEFADDQEYMESQRGILAEQDMKDTTKYSMSAGEYNALMQREHEKEAKEREDTLARQNLKKLESEIEQ